MIATGTSQPLETFVEETFSQLGLDWHDHVVIDPGLLRPQDLSLGRASPATAREKLGWEARSQMKDLGLMMVDGKKALQAD